MKREVLPDASCMNRGGPIGEGPWIGRKGGKQENSTHRAGEEEVERF